MMENLESNVNIEKKTDITAVAVFVTNN